MDLTKEEAGYLAGVLDYYLNSNIGLYLNPKQAAEAKVLLARLLAGAKP